MMPTRRKVRDRIDTRKDLRKHSNPYKRRYISTQELGRRGKPGTFDQVNRSLDRKYQERQSPSDDAGTDENNEAEERQGEDGEPEANRQEGGVGDQILRFHQGVDGLLKVLVAGFRKDNESLKNQAELQNSEYVNQVAVLKDQNETLTNQVEEKTTECVEVEQIAAQLKSEVEEWKTKFVDCAVKLGREIEAHRKENETLRTEKDSFKEENDLLKRQVEKFNTESAKVGQIAAQLDKTFELLKFEFVKQAELKNQNKLLEDQLAKWRTDCEKESQARKDLESQLTAFWTKLGIATPPSTSSGFTTPLTTERKVIQIFK